MQENARKRRRILAPPDGFSTSKSSTGRLQVQVPTFLSAFDDVGPSKPTKPKSTSSLQSSSLRLQSMKTEASNSSKPMRRQPVPAFLKSALLRSDNTTAPIPAKPVMKPLSATLTFQAHNPSGSTISLKPVQKHIPSIPEPLSEDTREMKPLTTTHFAGFADLSNDESIELTSILLRDYQGQSAPEPEADIHTSPYKSKHLRCVQTFLFRLMADSQGPSGGLAARAKHLYRNSQTAIYLWRTAIESQPDNKTTADITFRVSQVLSPSLASSTQPPIALTLSHVETPTKLFSSRKKPVYIVLKFPDSWKTPVSCNPANLKEGCVLGLWKPWNEVLFETVTAVANPHAEWPLPSSAEESTRAGVAEEAHNTILMCSRFTINQS